MKRIGIMGAMDLEIDLILEKMEVCEDKEIAGIHFYRGLICENEIILTCCGVGKVNAACSAQILASVFHVDYIINTGVAGGMDSRLGIKDVVISTDVTYHDVSMKQMQNCFPFMEYFVADEKLVQLCVQSCSSIENRKFQYFSGRIVTGEYFVADNEIKQSIIRKYKPLCVEMEGAAIGHAAYLNKIPFLVIRCISDLADAKATESFETFEYEAADISSSIVLKMLTLF
jgi:adenosylhomocysteine nucleosidase